MFQEQTIHTFEPASVHKMSVVLLSVLVLLLSLSSARSQRHVDVSRLSSSEIDDIVTYLDNNILYVTHYYFSGEVSKGIKDEAEQVVSSRSGEVCWKGAAGFIPSPRWQPCDIHRSPHGARVCISIQSIADSYNNYKPLFAEQARNGFKAIHEWLISAKKQHPIWAGVMTEQAIAEKEAEYKKRGQDAHDCR